VATRGGNFAQSGTQRSLAPLANPRRTPFLVSSLSVIADCPRAFDFGSKRGKGRVKERGERLQTEGSVLIGRKGARMGMEGG